MKISKVTDYAALKGKSDCFFVCFVLHVCYDFDTVCCRCCVLRITCKKVYRLVLVFCWFLVASVLLIRSQDVLVYSKHMGFYKVRHFLFER